MLHIGGFPPSLPLFAPSRIHVILWAVVLSMRGHSVLSCVGTYRPNRLSVAYEPAPRPHFTAVLLPLASGVQHREFHLAGFDVLRRSAELPDTSPD